MPAHVRFAIANENALDVFSDGTFLGQLVRGDRGIDWRMDTDLWRYASTISLRRQWGDLFAAMTDVSAAVEA